MTSFFRAPEHIGNNRTGGLTPVEVSCLELLCSDIVGKVGYARLIGEQVRDGNLLVNWDWKAREVGGRRDIGADRPAPDPLHHRESRKVLSDGIEVGLQFMICGNIPPNVGKSGSALVNHFPAGCNQDGTVVSAKGMVVRHELMYTPGLRLAGSGRHGHAQQNEYK